MKEFMQSKQSIIKCLDSNENDGLRREQVDRNKEKYGSNCMTKERKATIWKRISIAASEPMIVMLIMAGVIAVVVNVIRITTGDIIFIISIAPNAQS